MRPWARLLLGLASGAAALAAAETLVVGPGGYAGVQAAVDAAAPGDRVLVRAGVWSGDVEVTRTLTLEGEEGAVLRGSGRGSVITLKAPDCTVRGLGIEGSGDRLEHEDSGILVHSANNLIEGNRLRDILFGVYIFESNGNRIRDNRIIGRPGGLPGERGNGIHLWNSERNVLESNRISGTRDGIFLQYANSSTIRNNQVWDVRYGLHYMYSDRNTFEDNRFFRCVAGAAIMYSRQIVLRRNTFADNHGPGSFGILFQDSDDCLAEQNTLSNNTVALFMEALRHSTFRENLISANDTAIYLFTSSSRNEFTKNSFLDNLSPILIVGRASDNQWSSQGLGNYWSSYDGYDLDGDGIGDVPYRIQNFFEHLEGNHPRLRLYLFSPAAQALAFAERTFPVLRGSEEFDRYPLMKPPAGSTPPPAAGLATDLRGAVLAAALALVAGAAFVRGGRRD